MFTKYTKSGWEYFSKYPTFNSWAHMFAGIGFGLLIARPFAASHPVRWAIVFLGLTGVMHAYAMTRKVR